MKIEQFSEELLTIDPDLSIKSTPTKGLASVSYKGVHLLTCPDGEIFDEKSESYSIEILGRQIPHRTRPEVIDVVKAQIEKINSSKDEHDAFFSEGEYSDAALNRP